MEDRMFGDINFADNPDPRAPVVLTMDVSDSTNEVIPGQTRSGLEAMNGGLDTLYTELMRDELSRRRVELSFIPYGTEVAEPTPFRTVDDPQFTLPELKPMGITNTGAALLKALDVLEGRKQEYKQGGVEYYQPMLFHFSDGLGMDKERIEEAAERIKELEGKKRLSFFAIGFEGADMSQLNYLSNKHPALVLKDLRFEELFVWISQSAASVSASQPGEDVKPAKPESDWWDVAM